MLPQKSGCRAFWRKEPYLSQFLADKRNPALLVTGLLTVLFGGLLLFGRGSTLSGGVVNVGDHEITQQDVFNQLKATHGTAVLTDMIENTLWDKYAADKQVSVSDSEVDQLQRFQEDSYDFSNMNSSLTYEQYLDQQGITQQLLSDQLRQQALKIKLLVSDTEMKNVFPQVAKLQLVKNVNVFSLPTRYFYRQFRFADLKVAQNDIAKLDSVTDPAQEDAVVTDVAADAPNPRIKNQGGDASSLLDSNPILIRKYFPIPGVEENAQLDKVLSSLTAGRCSPPMAMKVKSDTGDDIIIYVVLQLVQVKPATQPDYANDYMIAGQLLLEKGDPQIYGGRERQLESKMIADTDIQFQSPDYDTVKNLFIDKKKKTPPTH